MFKFVRTLQSWLVNLCMRLNCADHVLLMNFLHMCYRCVLVLQKMKSAGCCERWQCKTPPQCCFVVYLDLHLFATMQKCSKTQISHYNMLPWVSFIVQVQNMKVKEIHGNVMECLLIVSHTYRQPHIVCPKLCWLHKLHKDVKQMSH